MEDELEAQAVEPVPDDNYEEDFEDYDDDGFESDEDEDEGWGAKAPPQTETSLPDPPAHTPPPPPPTYAQVASGKRIVESLLKAKSQTLNPALTIAAAARARRWALIRPKLTEVVMAPILDMPPRTLSELYASGQGAAARLAVKGVQTPLEDEIRTVDVQTEEVGTSESAAQYDVRDLVTKRVEGVVKGQNGRLAGLLERALQAVNQGRLGSSGLVDRVVSLMNHPRVQKYRAVQEILSFVKSAVRGGGTGASEGGGDEEKQLADLLEEALEGESTGRGESTADNPDAATTSLYHEELLRGRPVVAVSFCPTSESQSPTQTQPQPQIQPPLLLCCYAPSKEVSIAPRLGCLCVWDTSKPSRPQKVLVCEGTPSSCCWAPAKPAPAGEYGRSASSSRLVVVGTDSGSLALWDLSEPTGQHQDVTLNQGEGLTLRRPSYMTDWRPEVNHGARVCAVKVQQSPGSDDRAAETNCRNGLESGLGAGLESASGPLAQVLSLDVTGWLHVWSAVPVTELDSAVIDTDFGLRLGSRVRLLRVAAVDCFSATSPGRELGFDAVSQTAVGFATVPGDPSQLLVATEGGSVVRASRFGLPPASLPHPHRFAFGNSDVSGRSPTSVLTSAGRKEAGVTCLQAEGDALLVGYADGTIALYSLQSKRAVREWREIIRGAVWGLRWCRGQSSLFVALDSRSVLYLFDVSGDGSKPVKSIDLGSGGKVWTGDARDGRFDLCGVGAEWMLAVVQETGVTVRRIVKL